MRHCPLFLLEVRFGWIKVCKRKRFTWNKCSQYWTNQPENSTFPQQPLLSSTYLIHTNILIVCRRLIVDLYHLQHYSSLSNIHAGWNNCIRWQSFILPAELFPLFLKICKHAGWKKGMQVVILSKNNKICCRIICLIRVLYQWKQWKYWYSTFIFRELYIEIKVI